MSSSARRSEARRLFVTQNRELRSAGQMRTSAPVVDLAVSKLWLNCCLMFARRIRVEYEENGRRVACPLKWLDSFSMRNFTNATVSTTHFRWPTA